MKRRHHVLESSPVERVSRPRKKTKMTLFYGLSVASHGLRGVKAEPDQPESAQSNSISAVRRG